MLVVPQHVLLHVLALKRNESDASESATRLPISLLEMVDHVLELVDVLIGLFDRRAVVVKTMKVADCCTCFPAEPSSSHR
jgi:hypothetical protein